jgi:hypothetical protein
MGAPVLVPAAIGAVGSTAMGGSPIKGALLGGGLGYGLGQFGSSGLLSGLKGVSTTPVSLGTGGYASGIGGQIIPEAIVNAAPLTSATSTIPFGSQEFISPYTREGIVNFADGTTSTFAPDYLSAGVNYGMNAPNFNPVLGKSADFTGGGYNPSFFGRIGDMLGNPMSGLSTSDKLGLGLKGFDMLNQPQQMIQPPPPPPPIKQAAPNVLPNQPNTAGMVNLQTVIAQNPELVRLYPNLFGGR